MRIYEHLENRALETEELSPRARRLWARDQPRWLTSRIGRAPQSTRRGTSQNEKRRQAARGTRARRVPHGGRRSPVDEAAEVSPADPDNVVCTSLRGRRSTISLTSAVD
jgi:hypothetical protein